MDEFDFEFDETPLSEETEDWRPIPKYEGYLVNRHGQIYSEKRGRVLSPSKTNGKNSVKLSRKIFGPETKQVDRLVAEAFLSNPNDTRYVKLRHIDGDMLNDELDNLEWTNYPRTAL